MLKRDRRGECENKRRDWLGKYDVSDNCSWLLTLLLVALVPAITFYNSFDTHTHTELVLSSNAIKFKEQKKSYATEIPKQNIYHW